MLTEAIYSWQGAHKFAHSLCKYLTAVHLSVSGTGSTNMHSSLHDAYLPVARMSHICI